MHLEFVFSMLLNGGGRPGDRHGRGRRHHKHAFLPPTHSQFLFLLKELKSCCGSVVFLGIQLAQLEFRAGLTPAVHEAAEKIYGMLKAGSNFTRERFVKNGAWYHKMDGGWYGSERLRHAR